MDNRIPSIIQDFNKSKQSKSEINFLSFDDWLSENEQNSEDWIVVARDEEIGKYEDFFTFSCLVSSNNNSFQTFLSDCNWFVRPSFGIPSKYQEPYEGESYDDGLVGELNGITYEPFVFHRHFNNYIEDRFELSSHFLLYYNCFWVEEKNEYQAINDMGEISTVVKYVKKKNVEIILVDAHTLKDYLAVKGASLGRFHDHKRRSKHEISDFLDEEMKTYIISDNESYLELDLRIDIQFNDVKSTSRLLGKDMVKPYDTPKTHEWSAELDSKEYLDFIIGRNEKGKEVKETSNPNLLSSYHIDKGKPHFLTPVFFKKELLQKYYSEPSKYTVSEQSIEYLSIWRIEIDVTNENLVQAYLGDVGRDLPYNEQLHWRQFNVVPKGKISEHRYKKDFLVEFASPSIEEAPIMYFKQCFEELQMEFREKTGSQLFKDLASKDKHHYNTLHVPVTEEWKELDEQILALAKITTDSFDNSTLKKLTGKKIGDVDSNGNQIKGLSGLFYEFITQKYPDEDRRAYFIYPFNMIQAFRSSSVAHRKSKELEKMLVKYDLNGLSNEQKFKTIVIKLTEVLNNLKEEMWLTQS